MVGLFGQNVKSPNNNPLIAGGLAGIAYAIVWNRGDLGGQGTLFVF